MKKLVLGVALAAMLALPLNAMAAYYTLSTAQIQAMTAWWDDGAGGTALTSVTNTALGAKFSGTIRNNNPGQGFQVIGLDLGGVDLSAYDGFGLCLENVNENAWGMGLYAEDGSFGFVELDLYDVPTFTPIHPTVDWASGSIDATDVHGIGFFVWGDVPLGDQLDDYVYEVRVTPLPEPGTLALFGFGLAGAAASYRRKFAKKA